LSRLPCRLLAVGLDKCSPETGWERKRRHKMVYQDITEKVIGGVIAVHKALGPGLLEFPYHNALYYELVEQGLKVVYNPAYPVFYKGQQVGDYFADLVVEGKVIIEVKSVVRITQVHEAQLLNYMHISGVKVGFLVNFRGRKAEWNRFVL
jgi:GxxExxY protein